MLVFVADAVSSHNLLITICILIYFVCSYHTGNKQGVYLQAIEHTIFDALKLKWGKTWQNDAASLRLDLKISKNWNTK